MSEQLEGRRELTCFPSAGAAATRPSCGTPWLPTEQAGEMVGQEEGSLMLEESM